MYPGTAEHAGWAAVYRRPGVLLSGILRMEDLLMGA